MQAENLYTQKLNAGIKLVRWTFCNIFNSNLTLNEGSQRQIIKQVCKVFPDIRISIFSQAFIIEAIPESSR